MSQQITSRVFMVRPYAFGFNIETAANNVFQHPSLINADQLQLEAVREFDAMVARLRKEGVEVLVIQDTAAPVKPDAIFPNNWISLHEGGTIFTYPMFSPVRRTERRQDIIESISDRYMVTKHLSMTDAEQEDMYLEGTGSMVLDRQHRISYACISQRTHAELVQEWCRRMDYSPCLFHARMKGQDIYHTNVMMAIGDGVSVVCLDVVDVLDRETLRSTLLKSGRDVVELTEDQIYAFAGNMLALQDSKGEQLMVMSSTAAKSLTDSQRSIIERHARIVDLEVTHIEQVGGGSVRCMIAENFLSKI